MYVLKVPIMSITLGRKVISSLGNNQRYETESILVTMTAFINAGEKKEEYV